MATWGNRTEHNCVPSVSFSQEISQERVSFLDVLVIIEENKIHSDLFCKVTDSHDYLLYNSSHPQRCKDSIPYSQFLRTRRICSRTLDFETHVMLLSRHFIRIWLAYFNIICYTIRANALTTFNNKVHVLGEF